MNTSSNHTKKLIDEIQTSVNTLDYLEAGIAVVLFLMIIMYFPMEPKTPPAMSCEVERSSVVEGAKKVSGNTWMVIVAQALALGVSGAYGSVFDVNVSNYGIGQREAGWIGFIAVMAGTVCSLVTARIMDYLPNLRMATVVFGLLLVAAVSYLIFSLMCSRVIPNSTAAIYITNILANVCLYSTLPLFYELSCESAFPVAEEVSAALLSTANNVFCGLFLAILFFPQVGTLWMNYVMTGACIFALPLLLLFREDHTRRSIDMAKSLIPAGVTAVVDSPPDYGALDSSGQQHDNQQQC